MADKTKSNSCPDSLSCHRSFLDYIQITPEEHLGEHQSEMP